MGARIQAGLVIVIATGVAGLLGGCSASSPSVTKTVTSTVAATATPTMTVTSTVTATPTKTTTASPPPSDVTQVAPESCGPVLHREDGNFGNAICPDGHPNAQAVDLFRQGGSLTIDLDPNASPKQVTAALCHDNTAFGLTNPIRITLYGVASALNQWHFTQTILDPIGRVHC